MTLSRIFVAVAFSLLAAAPAALACSPAKRTPQQIVDGADKIIVADAVASKWDHEGRSSIFDGPLGAPGRAFSYLMEWLRGPIDDFEHYMAMNADARTTLRVHRTLKGKHVERIVLRHYSQSTMCGTTFNGHERYLIFVDVFDGKHYTSVFGVRPWLSEEEYKELTELIGLRPDDYVPAYRDYLEPEDAR